MPLTSRGRRMFHVFLKSFCWVIFKSKSNAWGPKAKYERCCKTQFFPEVGILMILGSICGVCRKPRERLPYLCCLGDGLENWWIFKAARHGFYGFQTVLKREARAWWGQRQAYALFVSRAKAHSVFCCVTLIRWKLKLAFASDSSVGIVWDLPISSVFSLLLMWVWNIGEIIKWHAFYICRESSVNSITWWIKCLSLLWKSFLR